MAKESGGKNLPTAQRLRQLRAAEGYKSVPEFAKRIGVKENVLYNMENGYPLSFKVAKQIAEAVPGVSIDWLVFGKEDHLHVHLLKRLAEHAGKPAQGEGGQSGGARQ